MRIIPILCIAIGFAGALPLAAGQQAEDSLGDLARQVRQQREKAPKPAKVITNDDIPPPPRGVEASRVPAAENSAESDKPKESTAKPASPETAQGKSGAEPSPSDGSAKDRVYWQAKFKEARERLARAKEEQQLAEDELNLLQIQQARELDSIAKDELGAKIGDKQSEVDTKKASTDEARKTLDALDQEFKDSGAPEEWSVTE